MKMVFLSLGLIISHCSFATISYELDNLLGEYQLEKNDHIYTTTVKEQTLSGIRWGSLGPEQWGATGNFRLSLQGNYQWGILQSYEHNDEEFRIATTLSCILYTSDGLYHDAWGSNINMWNYEEGTFLFLLEFTRGFSVWPPAFVDPLYDGDIIVALFHDRTLLGGDVITVPPVMTITEAILKIPEPANLFLLGCGILFMRERHH
jgi:hypothetical protein